MKYEEFERLSRWISQYFKLRDIEVPEGMVYQCLRDYDANEKLRKWFKRAIHI